MGIDFAETPAADAWLKRLARHPGLFAQARNYSRERTGEHLRGSTGRARIYGLNRTRTVLVSSHTRRLSMAYMRHPHFDRLLRFTVRAWPIGVSVAEHWRRVDARWCLWERS